MPVPHRQLYRIWYTKECAVPATRSGIVGGYRLMEPNVPYIVTGKMLERIQQADPDCVYQAIETRESHKDTKRLLIFFPGGIGDVICLRPCLEGFRRLYPKIEVGVVSTLADNCLIGDLCTLWDYPLREEIVNYYDWWVNVAELDRASIGRELQETFAEYIGIPAPQKGPRLKVDEQLRAALSGLVKDHNRPNMAIHMASACHFRSIPAVQGIFVCMALVEEGFDCYIVGGPEQKIVFTKDGYAAEPPPHIWDYTSTLGTVEAFVGFLSNMDVIISSDTAGLHVGGALGLPTLGIFGMTRGDKRTGYYRTVDYIQGEHECSPCERITHDPPCDNKCCLAIAGISPEYIAAKTIEVWQKWQ